MSKMKLLLASTLSVALVGAHAYGAPSIPSVPQLHGIKLVQWHRGGGGWRHGRGMGMGPLALDWPRRRGRGNHR